VGIYHNTLPTGSTGVGDPSKVYADDYSANHNHPGFLIWCGVSRNFGWTVPTARTEIFAVVANRWKYPFEWVEHIRLVANIQKGVTGSGGLGTISVQYSNDNGVTWGSFDGLGGPTINIAQAGLRDSGWRSLSSTVKAIAAPRDLLVRLVGEGGNGNKQTVFGYMAIYAR